MIVTNLENREKLLEDLIHGEKLFYETESKKVVVGMTLFADYVVCEYYKNENSWNLFSQNWAYSPDGAVHKFIVLSMEKS